MLKFAHAAVALALGLGAAIAAPTLVQAAPPAQAAQPRFSVDTPIEDLVANPAARKILDHHLPDLTSHPHYFMFKSQSLRQLAPQADGQLNDAKLAQIQAELVAIK